MNSCRKLLIYFQYELFIKNNQLIKKNKDQILSYKIIEIHIKIIINFYMIILISLSDFI